MTSFATCRTNELFVEHTSVTVTQVPLPQVSTLPRWQLTHLTPTTATPPTHQPHTLTTVATHPPNPPTTGRLVSLEQLSQRHQGVEQQQKQQQLNLLPRLQEKPSDFPHSYVLPSHWGNAGDTPVGNATLSNGCGKRVNVQTCTPPYAARSCHIFSWTCVRHTSCTYAAIHNDYL